MSSFFEEDIGNYSSESIELDDSVIKQNQCSNPESYITGDAYTSLDKHFYVYLDNSTFSDAYCANLNDEIIGAIKSDYDSGDKSEFSSFFSIGGGNPNEDYGCTETNQYIFKLNLSVPYFITIGSLDRVIKETNVSNWYLVKMFNGKRRRIINLSGSYGSSRHHCQIPGYYIYKAFTKQELLNGITLDEEPQDWLDEDEELSIFEIIKQYIPTKKSEARKYLRTIVKELKRGVYDAISEDKWGPGNSFNAMSVISWLDKEDARFLRRYLDIIETKGITPKLYDNEYEALILENDIPEIQEVFDKWISDYNESRRGSK